MRWLSLSCCDLKVWQQLQSPLCRAFWILGARHHLPSGGGEHRDHFLYDSNTGKPLFYGPRDRSWQSFVKESQAHGWPSFRDSEVNWEFVRVLPNGECISVDGTHLGHNLPDGTGNRYCINLVSVAGRPLE